MTEETLPRISTWADVQKLMKADKLTPAEKHLIAQTEIGEEAYFGAYADAIAGNPELKEELPVGEFTPKTKTKDVLIRAPLLRYMILGSCADFPKEAVGVEIKGAWISGPLNLEFGHADGMIALNDCHVADKLEMSHLSVAILDLSGSRITKGLCAESAEIKGHLLLRHISATEEVRVFDAKISGQLNCDNAAITDRNEGKSALNAETAEIEGSVLLSNLNATGEVRFAGAVIGGVLNCEGSSFKNPNGTALHLQRATVKLSFFWRCIQEFSGNAILSSAHVSDLVDDTQSWLKCDQLALVGLSYDVLQGTSSVTQRLDWLKKGAQRQGNFHPQPYEQLAKVLRGSGYWDEAAQIMVAKERAQRDARRQREYDRQEAAALSALTGNLKRDVKAWVTKALDFIREKVAGYGHLPRNAIGQLFFLVGIASLLAFATWRAGDFAPNSGVILLSDEWQDYATTSDNPAANWSKYAVAGKDYESFNALAYGADLVIPLISFGQEAAWAPSTSRSWMGWHMLWMEWVLTLAGWIVSAIGAAAVTNMIRRD